MNNPPTMLELRPLARRAARGVTLFELMAVTVIVLLVSTLVMRSIVPAMKERRIREAARMLNTMLNSARNRALETGRPAGIWMDRVPGLPEAVSSIHYAQVPEVYAGETFQSGIEAYIYPDPATTTNSRIYFNVVTSNNSAAPSVGNRGLEAWSKTSGLTQPFIHPADQMRVNFASDLWPLDTGANLKTLNSRCPTAPANTWVIGIGMNYLDFFFFERNEPFRETDNSAGPKNTLGMLPSGRYRLDWYTTNGLPSNALPYVTAGSTATSVGSPMPFQIMRQPVRMAAGAVQLPKGTIVDLNYSGSISSYGTGSRLITNFVPLYVRYSLSDTNAGTFYQRGFRWAPATDSASKQNTEPDPTTSSIDPILAALYYMNRQPIILTFNPSGGIDQFYQTYWVNRPSANGNGYWKWGNYKFTSTVLFMIGSASKVPANYTVNPSSTAYSENALTQMENNWLDLKNLIVAVPADTGVPLTSAFKSPFQTSEGQGVGGINVINGNGGNATVYLYGYITAIQNSIARRRAMGGD